MREEDTYCDIEFSILPRVIGERRETQTALVRFGSDVIQVDSS